MKIICDTNIWRGIIEGEIGEEKFSKVNAPLTLTFIAIDEIAKSNLILSNPEKSTQVIRRMIKMPAITIFNPPIIHLKKMDHYEYEYNEIEKHKDILDFLKGIANGVPVNQSNFKKYKEYRENSIDNFCDYINSEAKKIRPNIGNAKRHRKINTTQINREFISFLVKHYTGNPLSDNFNWEKIELFENVLSLFFKELETTRMKIKRNDVYDLFILLYVQPNDKIWTNDTKKGPLKYVSEVDNGKYLFNPQTK